MTAKLHCNKYILSCIHKKDFFCDNPGNIAEHLGEKNVFCSNSELRLKLNEGL